MTASLRRRLPVTALAVAALIGTGLAGTAQAAAVSGTVKTSTGVGVVGADVSIKVGGSPAVVVTTTAGGAFTATGADPGAATINLTGPATPNAELPSVWSIKGMSKTIAGGDTLTFTLPSTVDVTMHVAQVGVPIVGAKVTHCATASPNFSDTAVVLPGGGAVGATQDWNNAVTNATGDVTVRAFKDATLSRLCGGFSTTDLGAKTDFLVRSGEVDASVDVPFKQIFVPAVVEQSGAVKNSTTTGQAGLKVAIRSSGGQIDSTSPLTTAAGAFTTRAPAGDDLFVRISGTSLKQSVVPPTNVPRAFKATFDAVAGGPMTVNLPATVNLTIKVVNPNGSPVKGALIRPMAGGGYGTANPATLVTGAGQATLTQQIFGDTFSTATGIVSARLFPDGAASGGLGAFQIIKSAGNHTQRHVTIPAGTILTGATPTITVELPKL